MGLFDKFKKITQSLGKGLEKTKRALQTDVRDLFKKEGRLVDDGFLDELFEILIKTDIGYEAADEIRGRINTEYDARVVEMDDVLATIKQTLKELLTQDEAPIQFAEQGPTVIMVVGVNGSGKTTSIAKLAKRFVTDGKKVVMGAGDTFRAAAVEQLTIWAERLGVEIIKGDPGGDPASVAYRAVETALKTGADVCIVDTAGRLQTQKNLMDELTRIHRIIGKVIPEAPHEVLLVMDATTGQPGISQAVGFTEAVRCTGIVLAKLDGTAKGGVVVPIRQKVGVPVKFIGVGESADDLEVFNSDAFAEAMFQEQQADASA